MSVANDIAKVQEWQRLVDKVIETFMQVPSSSAQLCNSKGAFLTAHKSVAFGPVPDTQEPRLKLYSS